MSASPASSSFPVLTYTDALTLASRGHSLAAVDARLLLQHVTGATVAQIVMVPALGEMQVAMLPALDRAFTTYTLPMEQDAPRTTPERTAA